VTSTHSSLLVISARKPKSALSNPGKAFHEPIVEYVIDQWAAGECLPSIGNVLSLLYDIGLAIVTNAAFDKFVTFPCSKGELQIGQ
jgi:hypothetical protein